MGYIVIILVALMSMGIAIVIHIIKELREQIAYLDNCVDEYFTWLYKIDKRIEKLERKKKRKKKSL